MELTVKGILAAIEGRGLVLRPSEAAPIAAALAELARRPRHVPGVLALGAPGTGKTSTGEAIAASLGGRFLFAQLHEWSGADDLLAGVDAAAAVAGDAGRVRRLGILAQAAVASQQQPTVLLLDEVDKASEAAEALLLDFLQTGRAEVAPGQHVVAHPGNLLVWATSNEQRPHSEALLRRLRRVRFRQPENRVVLRLLRERGGLRGGAARLLLRMAELVAERDTAQHPASLPEFIRCATDLVSVAEDADSVAAICAAWLPRSEAGEAAIYTAAGRKIARALAAELRRGQDRATLGDVLREAL